jgi:hypothetical protein
MIIWNIGRTLEEEYVGEQLPKAVKDYSSLLLLGYDCCQLILIQLILLLIIST